MRADFPTTTKHFTSPSAARSATAWCLGSARQGGSTGRSRRVTCVWRRSRPREGRPENYPFPLPVQTIVIAIAQNHKIKKTVTGCEDGSSFRKGSNGTAPYTGVRAKPIWVDDEMMKFQHAFRKSNDEMMKFHDEFSELSESFNDEMMKFQHAFRKLQWWIRRIHDEVQFLSHSFRFFPEESCSFLLVVRLRTTAKFIVELKTLIRVCSRCYVAHSG